MLPLEYVQIHVYYSRHSDTRSLYSCHCECTLNLGHLGFLTEKLWMLCCLYVIVGLSYGDRESEQATGVVRAQNPLGQTPTLFLWVSLDQIGLPK